MTLIDLTFLILQLPRPYFRYDWRYVWGGSSPMLKWSLALILITPWLVATMSGSGT